MNKEQKQQKVKDINELIKMANQLADICPRFSGTVIGAEMHVLVATLLKIILIAEEDLQN